MIENEILQLTNELISRLQTVLSKATHILGRDVSEASLHAIIGGKNRTHGNVRTMTFTCFEAFFAHWLEAMYNDYLSRKNDDAPMASAGFRNAMLLREQDVMEYTELFLRRNFLRNYETRTGGNIASQQEIAMWSNKVQALKKTFFGIM